jgi:hypothetical protein
MANPLPNEKEIYERIEKENLAVHPLIWEIIDHHINNDLHAINLILGATVLDGESLREEDARKIIKHTKEVRDFLDKLEKVTKSKI